MDITRPNVHELKCWPEPFEAIRRGDKTHEIRINDRNYQVGDYLYLREWSEDAGYSGRRWKVRVTYLTPGGEWTIVKGMIVMSISSVLP